MFCRQCGVEIPLGQMCPRCGSNLEAAPGEVDPMIGRTLDGRYRIDARLGEGAMAVVYRGRHLKLERDIAVKVLKPTSEGDLVRRFEREAKIVSRLTSPHTVRVFDYGESGGVLYIAMEFLTGESLDKVIEEEGALSPERTLVIMSQVCQALEEAHALGLIHRDLKPANIFIDRRGGDETVRVLDFGITRLSESSNQELGISVARITLAGIVMGTPTYMAPEQAQDMPLDARTDLYSLGVVAYVCLTGRAPFIGTPGEVVFHHSITAPPTFSNLDPPVDVDARIEALVMQLLAKNPELRPPSAAALRAQVDRLLTRRGIGHAASKGPLYALWGVVALVAAFLTIGLAHYKKSSQGAVHVEALPMPSRVPDGFFDVPLGD